MTCQRDRIDSNEIATTRCLAAMTQKQFARAIGCQYQAVLKWEAGRAEPQERFVEKIREMQRHLYKKHGIEIEVPA